MPKYEYQVKHTSRFPDEDEETLDFAGESGWELVAVCNGRMYLKKTLDDAPPQPQKATP